MAAMPAQRIMVLGATGFIGPAILRRAVARGHCPVAVSRRGKVTVAGVECVSLDRGDTDALAACIRSIRPDAVIDLLAYTARATLPLLGSLVGQVGRYVLASSGDVYRQYDLLHRREVGVPLPTLREEAPLRSRLYPYRTDPPRSSAAPDAWMDEYDKIPIEQALPQFDLSWSVLRLPMIYGPGDRNRRFGWALGQMLDTSGVLKIDAEWANWRASLGFVDDVAEALVLAAVEPHAHARTFNVGPLDVKSNLEWACALPTALGWRGEVRVVSRDQIPEPTRSRLVALDLAVPIALSTEAIRQAIGYSEVVDLADRLAATIQADRAIPEV
jgi:nucleoside-diphosphate-sugar epimerase